MKVTTAYTIVRVVFLWTLSPKPRTYLLDLGLFRRYVPVTTESMIQRNHQIEAILQGPLHGSQPCCFLTVVLDKTLESLLDCKKIKPANPEGNQHWIIIGSSDAEVEAPILWPLDVKSWLTRKNLDAGKDWRQKEKGTAEDEMVR